MSAKGQVVIPKDVRDALGLKPGQELDVVRSGDGVFLRKPTAKSGRSTEEIIKAIRALVQYDGPPVPIKKLGYPSPEEWQAWSDGRPAE